MKSGTPRPSSRAKFPILANPTRRRSARHDNRVRGRRWTALFFVAFVSSTQAAGATYSDVAPILTYLPPVEIQ